MALPNPTKIDYINVDDITPTEMNNVGKNLDALGQKIQKVGDDVWITTNADHDGANWNRIDIAKAATAIKIGIDGIFTYSKVAAGANPITWAQLFVSSDIALLNAANTFAANQEIQTGSAAITIDATVGNPSIDMQRNGTTSFFLSSTAANKLDIANSGGSTVATLDISTDPAKWTECIVPLARLSASDANSGYPQSGTGGEANIRIIRGVVASGGGITKGAGFTVTKGSTGIYTLNWTTSYGDAPAVVATCLDGPRFVNAGLSTISACNVLVYTEGTNVLQDGAFSFTAIGGA